MTQAMDSGRTERWLRENRTGAEYVRDQGAAFGSIAELERAARVGRGHLTGWLRDPARGLRPETRVRLRELTGIPTSALVERDRRICDVIRDELGIHV